MEARPPNCILFPYTTLFRSEQGLAPGENEQRGGVHRENLVRNAETFFGRELAVRGLGRTRGDVAMRALEVAAADRKSTCLNSSHVENSYAVCCLKKKSPNKR